MVRITFLIGNGFDINVGLKTKYAEFYQYYKQQNPDDMIAKAISGDDEYWSDLEEGLGKYTANVTQEDENVFWESEGRLEDALADYLETQMKRIQVSDKNKEKIAAKMQHSLMNFYKEFPKEQQQFLERRINAIQGDIIYSFVSFNYTDALDRCTQLTKEQFSQRIGTHRCGGFTYSHFMGDILHIHGTVNEEMILGVNDITQIGSKEFVNHLSYRQLLIKEEMNKRFAQNKTQEMRNIIEESVIICVFGMSIGATDKMWWNYICKWLTGGEQRRLLLFAKRDGTFKRITKRIFSEQDKTLERLKVNSGFSEEEWEKIKDKVFIKYNSGLFDFKLTED